MSRACLAVGHCTLDVYGDEELPGGSVLYAARVWQALGAEARIFTATGPGFPTLDVPMETTSSPVTTTFTNLYGPTGRTQYVAAQAPPLDVPEALTAPDVLFLAPVLGEIALRPWLATPARLKAVGLQGWLKRPGPREGPGRRVLFGPDTLEPGTLRGADVACLSEEDLAGDTQWLEALREVVPVVALTLGERGALIFEGRRETSIGVVPVEARDPTGAGDSFAAGLCLGIYAGLSPVQAAWLGAAAAAEVIRHRASEAPLEAIRASAQPYCYGSPFDARNSAPQR